MNQQSLNSPVSNSPSSIGSSSNNKVWMMVTIYISLAVLVFSVLAYYSMFDTIIAAILGLTGAYLARKQGSKRYMVVGLLSALANVIAYVVLESISSS